MRYNKTTIATIEKSIRHWERMRDNKRITLAGIHGVRELEMPIDRHCALCRKFEECEGCPVAEYTKNDFCDGTPYYEAEGDFSNVYVYEEKSNGSMNKEVQFLKEVLKWAKEDV